MRRYRSLRNRKPLARVGRGALGAREKQERQDAATARSRAQGRCEVTLGAFRCERSDQETHHVVKRSQGGKFRGPDYLMRVCRTCHALTDAAVVQATHLLGGGVVRGRLRIVAIGGGTFKCWMEEKIKAVTA